MFVLHKSLCINEVVQVGVLPEYSSESGVASERIDTMIFILTFKLK